VSKADPIIPLGSVALVFGARPLPTIAGGAALVLVDFRIEPLDLVPDPLGWLLIAAGASTLALTLSMWLAMATALLSFSDVYLPYRYMFIDQLGKAVERCPPLEQCGERVVVFEPVSGWRLAAVAATVVVGACALIFLLVGLCRRALADGDETSAARLVLLAGAVGLGCAVPPVVGIAWAIASNGGAYDPVWNGSAEYVALVGVLALAWVIVELCVRSGAGWATPKESQLPSPWSNR
jgi:hypothetical protein